MFNVGDRVKRIKDHCTAMPIGFETVVESVSTTDIYCRGPSGSLGFWYASNFELVQAAQTPAQTQAITPVKGIQGNTVAPLIEKPKAVSCKCRPFIDGTHEGWCGVGWK